MKNYLYMWRYIFDYKTTTDKKSYWSAILVNTIIFAVLCILMLIPGIVGDVISLIAVIFGLASLIPITAMSVRRLHDTDRYGYNMFYIFIPILGAVLLTTMLLDGTNYKS